MEEYTEPTKNKARQLVIEEAIKTLTLERYRSTLTRRAYVREVRNHLVDCDNEYDVTQASLLTDGSIDRWESFYDSIIQSKKPSNLKVAYLSGPNPENDLRVFFNAGLLPENIWAFESEKSIYSQAVASALSSEFPFCKIVHGGIDSFFEASPQRFDIIYLDFCGPLPNRSRKQKTLSTITRILAYHSLNSPGILITNVALPTYEQDPQGRALLSKLVAHYLYPKEFIEDQESENSFSEGAISQGFEFDEWLKFVTTNLDEYYGQFITRLLIDHAGVISPYDRFPRQNALFSKFFKIQDKVAFSKQVASGFHFDSDYGGGDVLTEPASCPILWALAAINRGTNAQDTNYPQHIFIDKEFEKFSDSFISQLSLKGNKKELIDSLSTLSFLLSQGEGQENYLSDSIRKIFKNHKSKNYYLFCDLLLFHQIIEMLFRQIATPYHTNIERVRRWKYQAKETLMYMDMTVLDECRYLYDWMPTSDMFSFGISDTQRQLIYRFVLDGIGKHGRWYSPEYFSGTAVIDQFTEGFEAKTLNLRQKILP